MQKDIFWLYLQNNKKKDTALSHLIKSLSSANVAKEMAAAPFKFQGTHT